MNDERIPIAVTMSGKKMASPFSSKSILAAETTRAAQVASASDPNRSAPIPAISPTLSPTLSAIVPGFYGESSSNPSQTLPAKSAPTSAALV